LKRLTWIGLVMGVLLLAGLLAGCAAPAVKSVRLQDPEARMPLTAPKATAITTFRVAGSSILSPMETVDGYEPLLKDIAAGIAVRGREGKAVCELRKSSHTAFF